MTRSSSFSLAVALVASLAAGCTEHHVAPDDASAPAVDAGPRVCSLAEGIVRLTPDAANPPGCAEAVSCRVWFGHGQHLSCPDDEWTEPSYAGCSIWDCLCTDLETERFVADFSTGEVVDARDGARTCRYTIEPSP